jgi:catalase
LQIIGKMKDPPKGRAVGILIHERSDAATIKALKKVAEAAGAIVRVVAPKLGGAALSDGEKFAADGQLTGTPSVMFDAVAIVLSDEAGKVRSKEAAVVDFVRDAFGHLKAIAASSGAQAVLQAGGIGKDAGVVGASDSEAFAAAAKTGHWDREAKVCMLA